MCGIFGSIRLDGSDAAQDEPAVRRGVAMLRHRGPDGSGVETVGPACLGHARLSIIDPGRGAQPMLSPDRSTAITYNGEIYNHLDLRRELERSGPALATACDTEVALRAWQEYGAGCVERFRGMFAFCAVDLRQGKALLARDRIGIKPLFYARAGGRLVFSSELEPLYRVFGPFRLDLLALDEVLAWQYAHAPRTIYQEVQALLPGHVLSLDLASGAVEQRRYWRLAFSEDRSLAVEEWADRLDAALGEAVRIRLMSDVPFGAFLSGGVDSSLVVAHMSRHLDTPLRTFSIGFAGAADSELPAAATTAAALGTVHRAEVVTPDSLDLLPGLVRSFGQPFADSSAIPTFHVSRMAAREVKMVLSGDGGDEALAGYTTYTAAQQSLSLSLAGLRRGRGRARILAVAAKGYRLAQRLALGIATSGYALHSAMMGQFSPRERRRLFLPRLREAAGRSAPARREHMGLSRAPLVSRLQHLDIMTYLPGDILFKVDTMSMANSLEVRVPFLDHRFLETAAQLPRELKLAPAADGWTNKALLRRLAARHCPPGVAERPKTGFGAPLGQWLAGPQREQVRSRLLHSPALPLLFEPVAVRRLLDRHGPDHDLSARLWNLLVIEEWLRTHGDALAAC